MYRVCFLEAAARDLARLDKTIAQRILRRIQWLAANIGQIQPQPLVGDLAGLYKLRVGDYRVVYEILPQEQTIVVHLVDHRRDVYRQ